MRKNAYKKSFKVTQSHGVISNKFKSVSLICFIHQEGWCTTFYAILQQSRQNSKELSNSKLL